MHRALWLIDGFNLYHSLLRSERATVKLDVDIAAATTSTKTCD